MLLGLPDEVTVEILSSMSRAELCRLQLKKRCLHQFIDKYFGDKPPFAMLREFWLHSPWTVYVDNRIMSEDEEYVTLAGDDKKLSLETAIAQLAEAKYLRAEHPMLDFNYDETRHTGKFLMFEDGDWMEGVDIGYGPYSKQQIDAIKHIWEGRPLQLCFIRWHFTFDQLATGFGNCSKLCCELREAPENFTLPELECDRLIVGGDSTEIPPELCLQWLYTVPNKWRKIDTKYLILCCGKHYKFNLQEIVDKLKEDCITASHRLPVPFVLQIEDIDEHIYREVCTTKLASEQPQTLVRNERTGEQLVTLRHEWQKIVIAASRTSRMLLIARFASKNNNDKNDCEFNVVQWLTDNRYPQNMFREFAKRIGQRASTVNNQQEDY